MSTLVTVLLVACCASALAGDRSPSTEVQTANSVRSSSDLTAVRPLPEKIATQICGLHRYTSEADLIARFGRASIREAQGDNISIIWATKTWQLVAMWSAGELQIAGAHSYHPDNPAKLVTLSEYPKTLRAGESTQSEVNKILGSGVLIAVSWHHGIDIDELAAKRNGVSLREIEDHCSRRFTFVAHDNGELTTLAFRDGILDGGFDIE